MYVAGIDVGSRTLKAVILDCGTNSILASGVMDQGVQQDALARNLFQKLLDKSCLQPDDVSTIVATGYGRQRLGFAHTTITEISCHSAGVRFWIPDAATIIEMGGQDSKCIRLDSQGAIRDFSLNERCAAGTGRFLEVITERLGNGWEALARMRTENTQAAPINSTCVVFAETEVISLLAGGTPANEILAGVQKAIAQRIASMAGSRIASPVMFTGGVALVPGMAEALQESLQHPIRIAPEPLMTGALGAALLARQITRKNASAFPMTDTQGASEDRRDATDGCFQSAESHEWCPDNPESPGHTCGSNQSPP